MTTSATPLTTTWRALTVMLPGELACSLITISPLGMGIVCFGAPLTFTLCQFTTRPAISELPLVEAVPPLHEALARDNRKSAAIALPPTVRLRLATEAS